MLKPPSFDGGFSSYIRKNKPSKAIIIMSPFSFEGYRTTHNKGENKC
jgi:hypothetical protein